MKFVCSTMMLWINSMWFLNWFLLTVWHTHLIFMTVHERKFNSGFLKHLLSLKSRWKDGLMWVHSRFHNCITLQFDCLTEITLMLRLVLAFEFLKCYADISRKYLIFCFIITNSEIQLCKLGVCICSLICY